MNLEPKSILASAGLTRPEDLEDCLVWAFGDQYGRQLLCDAAGTWNARHGHLFQVRGSDSIEDTIRTIGKLYKKLFVEE